MIDYGAELSFCHYSCCFCKYAAFCRTPITAAVSYLDTTHHTMIGIVHPVDHGLHHGLVRSCGTPDSLLQTHGHSPTKGQHGGRYDPQPVTRSSE